MLIVDARRHGQQDLPCHTHALTAYRFAVQGGHEWIRVDKPGHRCDFMVAALRESMNKQPAFVPKCIVNATRAEHERLGSTFDPLVRNWQGASLHR